MRDIANKSQSNVKEEELILLRNKEEQTRKTLIESQTKWTNFCKGILGMCSTLLEIATNPNPNVNSVAKIKEISEKLNKYEGILANNEENFKDIEQMYKENLGYNNNQPKHLVSPLQIKEEIEPQEKIVLPIYIQFPKIKEFLQTSQDYLKICAILQALRWKITRTRHGTPRKAVLQTYIDNDLLGCNTQGSTLFEFLIKHPKKKYSIRINNDFLELLNIWCALLM